VSPARARQLSALGGSIVSLMLLLALASAARASAARLPVGSGPLEGYVAGIARAWEPYTTPDGRIEDPLDPADTGDNYGVILLADVMLQVARRTDDAALESAGTRIVASALTLPVPNDPFNLFAIAVAIHDGQSGEFPVAAWTRIAGPLIQRAGQIGMPTEATCLTEPDCYDNWRLVWSAGAALLLSENVGGVAGSLIAGGSIAGAQVASDLAMAVHHAGAPLAMALGGGPAGSGGQRSRSRRHGRGGPTGTLAGPAAGGIARELSDPGAEPPAYELFSAFMLELVAQADPHAIYPAVARLRRQADRYALDMMAPDGQLSLSGRSLDQSWVQAAAAALGARRASLEPAVADLWRAYAERAVSYLLSGYPIRADGLLPIVPGLSAEWSPAIMDGYAALNQYEGLTLWLLSDALARWPRAEASRAALPADNHDVLADDLGSSGLVWGRTARVWWQLSGRSTGADPRSAQGLVAVKTLGAAGWRDLLALRPLSGQASSAWTLELPGGATATPSFTRVRGSGRRAVLLGSYVRADGRPLARASWTVSATAAGVRLQMSKPARATLHTTVWLLAPRQRLSVAAGEIVYGECTVTASGRACPATIVWHGRHAAVLRLGA
jgi:hypothetical protein